MLIFLGYAFAQFFLPNYVILSGSATKFVNRIGGGISAKITQKDRVKGNLLGIFRCRFCLGIIRCSSLVYSCRATCRWVRLSDQMYCLCVILMFISCVMKNKFIQIHKLVCLLSKIVCIPTDLRVAYHYAAS